MNDNLNTYIEELYNTCMWFTDQHRQLLYAMRAENDLSDEDSKALVEQNADSLKKNFAKVFKRMGNKTEYYSIPCSIFPVGANDEIIVSCKYAFQKLIGWYKVVIVPFYHYEYLPFKTYTPYTEVIQAKDNTLRIPYHFEKEDMYAVNIFYLLDGEELLLLSSNVYALDQDLYGCNFYKADFHIHTTHSDGYEPPELVVVSARERGMDIIAVTDHNAFSGSVAAREKAEEMKLDMTVIPGEEYSLEYSPMHILALGAEKAIERKYLTRQVLDMPETKRIAESRRNISCNVEAYACTQVLLDEISRIGGISILAHPYWKPISLNGARIDTPENLYIELGKDRKFAGIEIVSGSPEGECNVSNLQASLARMILGTFEGFAIIGITDSHHYATDSIAGRHFTVVFAKSKDKTHVLEALRNGLTVAVELVDGVPLCYGSHRLVKLTEFLLKYYFPARDQSAWQEAMSVKKEYLLTRGDK